MNVIEKHKMTILIVFGIVLISGGLYLLVNIQENEQLDSSVELTLESVIKGSDEEIDDEDEGMGEVEKQVQSVHVDIKGAIEIPGVYEMMANQRVIDVVHKAGGLKDDSDSNTVNFAKQLEDEMMIYIPSIGEEVVVELPVSLDTSDGGRVNINQADLNELLTLNGVGPQKAQEIISYRESNGQFSKVEDIMNVSGIGEKTFEKIQDQLTVK